MNILDGGNNQLVGNIAEPAAEVLTFVGVDGESLRSYLIELNRIYADSVVQRNKAAPVVQALSEIYQDVAARGVNRQTMQALESYGLMIPEFGVTMESAVPLMAYTERRSMTNQRPALEAIDLMTGGLIAAAGAAAIYLLYKMYQWLVKVWDKEDPEKLKSSAKQAADGIDEIAKDDNADRVIERVEKSTSRGRAVDQVHTTYSALVKDYGSPTGLGRVKSIKETTLGFATYIDKASDLLEAAVAIAQDLKTSKEISTADVAKIEELCKTYNSPVGAWPGMKSFLSGYGVGLQRKMLAAVAVETDDIDKTIAELKTKMAADADKPALSASKLAKHDMAVIQSLLGNILSNVDPASGVFPDSKSVARNLEARSTVSKQLAELYREIAAQPKPENAISLAKLADLNHLCSIWGKLMTDYTAVVKYILDRIGAFTGACTQFVVAYKAEADAVSPV